MKSLFRTLILAIVLLLSSSIQELPVYPVGKDGRPTRKGIELYVHQNQNKFLIEYQKVVNDSLYDVYMTVDDLSQYNNGGDALGFCISGLGSSEIIISNEAEKYMGYEVGMLSKFRRSTIIESNNFVKGVIFHELTHLYFNQVIRELRLDSLTVASDYNNFSMIPRNSFGSKFIEEGICMYISIKIGECIHGQDYMPETMKELMDNQNSYQIMYQYSAEYVQSFLNYWGIKRGIQILVHNKPPTYEEILYPSKFYSRLETTLD